MFSKNINCIRALATTMTLSLGIGLINIPVSATTNQNSTTDTTINIDATIEGKLNAIEIKTSTGIAPTLPSKVTISSEEGTSVDLDVKWDSIDSSKYSKAGAFTIYGTVEGITEKAQVNITVVDGNGPLFSFEVISDTHVTKSLDGTYSKNLDNALKQIKSINEGINSDSIGLMINGDVTDNGLNSQWDVYDQILEMNDLDTSSIYETFGNHDTWGLTFSQSLQSFYEHTGTDSVYFDEWINGYHFIFLGTEKSNGNNAWLSDTQLQWFEEKLAEDSKNDKPVFVFLHQGLVDTAAGTKAYQGWHGVTQDSQMQEIISKYPQTMLFSGHSHWELKSTDSVFNEGSGTFVNTSAGSYLWSDAGKTINGSEGWLLDVYEDKVVLKGRDFTNNQWVADAQYTIEYKNENVSNFNASMQDIENIEGKTGTEIKIPMSVDNFPTDQSIRSAEMVFNLPSDVTLTKVELNNKIINVENWDYNVKEGTLRVALTNIDETPIFTNNVSGNKNVLTLTVELSEDKSTGDVTTIKMPTMVLRCENDVDVVYNTNKAVSNISFVEKETPNVFPRELYTSVGEDVIPVGYKAYAIEFTGINALANITLNNNTDLHYSPEFTERNGKLTYITLLSENIDVTELENIDNYTIDSNKEIENVLMFGDINCDGIDAQDALAAVSSWLRNTNLNNSGLLTINVSGDENINTRDAIDIVDNYISGKEFKILNK